MIGGVLTEEQKAAMTAKLNAANEKIKKIKTPTDEELDRLLKSVDKEGSQIPTVVEQLNKPFFNPKEFGKTGNNGGKRKTRKNKKRKTRKGRKGRKGRKSRK